MTAGLRPAPMPEDDPRLPRAPEAERLVLQFIVAHPNCIPVALEAGLESELFISRDNREIARVALELHARGILPHWHLVQAAIISGDHRLDDPLAFEEFDSGVPQPDPPGLAYFIGVLQDRGRRRRLLLATTKVRSALADPDVPLAEALATFAEDTRLVTAPEAEPRPAPRPQLCAVRALDVITAPLPAEIIEGVASVGRVTVLPSESGAGKTFVLLDLAAAVSDDVAWHGRATRQGSVVYASYEGDALGLRLRALRDTVKRRLEHLYIIRAADPLSPLTRDGELPSLGEGALTLALATLQAELASAHRPPLVLLIIDTVRASLAGSEDSSEHVSAYLRAVRRILVTIPGAACILAHHTGWQDGESQKKRERGSSAWRGNCDATLYLEAGDYDAERGDAALTLRTLKVRDAERPAPLHLVRRRVELASCDSDGRPLTSCIVERDLRTRDAVQADAERAVEAEQRAVDLAVLRAIRDGHITSQSTLRSCVGLQRDVVNASLARVLHRGHVEPPPKQRHPYSLTPIGARIAEAGAFTGGDC